MRIRVRAKFEARVRFRVGILVSVFRVRIEVGITMIFTNISLI